MSFTHQYKYGQNLVTLDVNTAGEQFFDANNHGENNHEIAFKFTDTITAGTVTVKARPHGSDEFIAIDDLTAADMTGAVFAQVVGNIEEFSVEFSGVTAPAQTEAVMTDSAS